MREIVLDTETTGLSPAEGDRIVEIGAVELINLLPTGKIYHTYIHPERIVPAAAQKVHGLTDDFLKDKPVFKDIVQEFIDFIADDMLVIHNAAFDIGFLNAEIKRSQHPLGRLKMDRVIDTLKLAKQKFPRLSNSLDSLCNRFNIDKSHRETHGALIDCHLLAEVYLELKGGRQTGFSAGFSVKTDDTIRDPQTMTHTQQDRQAYLDVISKKKIIRKITQQEQKHHQIFVEELSKNSVWKKYL